MIIDMRDNHRELWKGLLTQDENTVRIIIPKLIEMVQDGMNRLTRMTGCRCNKEEILVGFIRDQMVSYREKLIQDPSSRSSDLIKSLSKQCLESLQLYESIVITPNIELLNILKKDTKDLVKNMFSLMLEGKQLKNQETILDNFVELQFKKFKQKLRIEPDDFFVLTPGRFSQFAMINLIDCPEIHEHVKRKTEKFIADRLYHKHWFKSESQRLTLVIEDLVEDSILEFYRTISKQNFDNPFGLLRIICQRKAIDHYNKNKIKLAYHPQDSPDLVKEMEIQRKRSSGPAEVYMDHHRLPEQSDQEDIISSIDLKKLANTIEDDCPNKDHMQLLRLQIEGLKYKEISAITGYKADSAKQIVSNVKKKIRIKVGYDYLS